MPLIDLTYPAGALTHEARTALADELTTVLLRAERAPDTEFFRSAGNVVRFEQLREAAAYEREQAAEPSATA